MPATKIIGFFHTFKYFSVVFDMKPVVESTVVISHTLGLVCAEERHAAEVQIS